MNCLFICDDDNTCKRTKHKTGHYCWQDDESITDILEELPSIKSKKLRRNPEKPTAKETEIIFKAFQTLGALVGWSMSDHERYGGYSWTNKQSIDQHVNTNLFTNEEPKKLSAAFRRKYPQVNPHIVRRAGVLNKRDSLKYLDPRSTIWDEDFTYDEMDPKTFRMVPKKVDVSTMAPRLSIRNQILDGIGQSFKIHLQPKPQYQYAVLERIFRIAAQSKAFSRQIDSLKTIISYEAVMSDRKIPALVIYPVYGVDIATFILNVLIAAFEGDDTRVGLNKTPRYNKKINNLIYVAGYEGSDKKYLVENDPDLLETLFDEDYVFFKCPKDIKCEI